MRRTDDPYEVLGLERGADDHEVRTRYRELARRYHPNTNGGDASAEWMFKQVNAAHAAIMEAGRENGAPGSATARKRTAHDGRYGGGPPPPPRPHDRRHDNEDHVDRSLVVLVAGMIGGSLMVTAVLAAAVGGFSPDPRFERAECERAAARYMREDNTAAMRSTENELNRACGGPHAFWQRAVFDPLHGTTSCFSAVANYLREKKARAPRRELKTLRTGMTDACRTYGGNS